MIEDLDVIKEFVIESAENLGRLDVEMVELERTPADAKLLASIFRTIHTIKGTCGFLGFGVLERITHQAENILSQVRNGERELTQELVSLVLETVDAIRTELASIEATSSESGAVYEDLVNRQKKIAETLPEQKPVVAAPPARAAVAPNPQLLADSQVEAGLLERPPAGADRGAADAEQDTVAVPKNASVADSTIRVDVGHLDKLMNLVGELVLARNQILQFNAHHEDAALNATSQRLNLITTELQEGVMKTRMQPIGMVWGKLPRVVRDLSASCGKQIAIEMEGAETELDKTIIEAIKDPLTHIVRNSCDHGIELPGVRETAGKNPQGKLLLRAFHEGGNVIIDISDDGAGIDPQKVKRSAIEKGLLRPEQAERLRDFELVNLVFLPGFSTASRVSNISGRGVGMDVVKTNVEKIGGAVELTSRPGKGITVKVRIPLTLAIIPGLVVTSGGQRFVIPQGSLIELVRLEGADEARHVEWLHGVPVCRRRGRLLPLIFLNEALKLVDEKKQEVHARPDYFNMIVLQTEERQFGLIVDSINDTQEIVVKPLARQLKSVACFAGATIMGDGRVALILDVLGLARCTGLAEVRVNAGATPETAVDEGSERQALLLFRAGSFERLAVPLSLVARLEEIPLARVERAAGRTVVQYRENILPLVALAARLEGVSEQSAFENDPAQVIVFSDGDRRIGLVVDQILDIVDDTVSMKKPSDRAGLLGSAVVGRKVTDFLDLQSVIEGAGEAWFEGAGSRRRRVTVLLAEPSPFSRGLLRNTLEIAGYRVLEAASAGDALLQLGKHDVDVMLAALDLPDGSAATLLESVRSEPALSGLPIFALSAMAQGAVGDGAFDEYFTKVDRVSMLRSLGKLAAAVNRSAERETVKV